MVMPIDLRNWLEEVEKIGELLRIKELDKIAPEVEEMEKPRQIKAPPRSDSPTAAAGGATPLTLPGGNPAGAGVAGARGMRGE